MAVTIASLISTCPAPVSDASGVTSGLTWLATTEAFCLTQDDKKVPTKHTIINASESLFFKTPNDALSSYGEFNDGLSHIKLLLSGVNAIT